MLKTCISIVNLYISMKRICESRWISHYGRSQPAVLLIPCRSGGNGARLLCQKCLLLLKIPITTKKPVPRSTERRE